MVGINNPTGVRQAASGKESLKIPYNTFNGLVLDRTVQRLTFSIVGDREVYIMLNFLYWFSSLIITIIFSYVTYKFVKKIKNTKIHQSADVMEDVKGANFKLLDGEDFQIINMEIIQNSKVMQRVSGLSFEASGTQSAELINIKIKQPGVEVIISDDPNVKVEINKQI